MTLFPARPERDNAFVEGNLSALSCAAFTGTVALSALVGGDWAPAIYLLSFWHYWLYALAYVFRTVPLEVFKRDAIEMKTVALAALAFAYSFQPLDSLSLAIVGLGFGLMLLHPGDCRNRGAG